MECCILKKQTNTYEQIFPHQKKAVCAANTNDKDSYQTFSSFTLLSASCSRAPGAF